MHWGVEYQNTPNKEQTEIANYLSSLGVDIIIGNHPHILQPITKINNTIVMYSLGNFISNQYGGSNGDWNKLIGFMATLDITKTVNPDNSSKIEISNLGGELIFTKYTGNPTTTAVHYDHTVIPFSMMDDDRYLKDYRRLNEKYSKLHTSMGTNLNIASVALIFLLFLTKELFCCLGFSPSSDLIRILPTLLIFCLINLLFFNLI